MKHAAIASDAARPSSDNDRHNYCHNYCHNCRDNYCHDYKRVSMMVTYLYWFLVIALTIGALWLVGVGMGKWGAGLIIAALVFLIGLIAYYFHFQQVFVKRWGGVMSLTVPAGQLHMGVTWKDDNLWVENYDPASNTCEFREYARGDLLEGRVIIKNCNPLKAP